MSDTDARLEVAVIALAVVSALLIVTTLVFAVGEAEWRVRYHEHMKLHSVEPPSEGTAP